jgi:tetratricopeptide (TPR) repeat protein
MDDPYRAMAHYKYALDAKPDYAHALNNMAAMYQNEVDDSEEAIGYLKKALEVAEGGENKELLTTIYINLLRLHLLKKDDKTARYYRRKMLTGLGFPEEMADDLEDDEDGGDVLA